MLLPQLAGGILFPDDNIPEKDKLDPSFGLKCGRALYSRFCAGGTYFSMPQLPEMQDTRNYGAGMQSTERYKSRFFNGSPVGSKGSKQAPSAAPIGDMTKAQRKALVNISYDIFSPMRKMTNVLLSVLADNDYKVDCLSLDRSVIETKRRSKATILARSKVVNPFLESIGLKKLHVPFVARDQSTVDMADRLGFFKARYEVALEKLAESGFRAGKYKDQRMAYNRDAIDYHIRIGKIYNDEKTGQVKPQYIDPARTVMLWNEDNESDPVAIGHIEVEMIQSIYPKLKEAGFSDKEIQSMAKSYVPYQTDVSSIPAWAFERKDPTTNKWVWMDFKVYVLKFEYLSTDYSQYVERTNKKGVKTFLKNNVPVEDKKKNPNENYHEVSCNYWYEGSYIISGTGQDRIYGWRKKPNQMQGGLTPKCSYVVDRIYGQSPTRSVKGLLDDLMIAVLKLRAAVFVAAPKGYRIDIGEAANIKIGGVEYDLFDLVHVHRQNGILVAATKFNAATGKYVSQPLVEMDNGLGPQGQEWLAQIANIQLMIKDILGIPDAMAASPDQSAERLVGVMEADYNAGNHANWPLKESERRFKEKMAERMIHQARIDIQFDPDIEEFYRAIIGDNLVNALHEIEDLSLDDLAITCRSLPNEKEKDAILQRAIQMSQIPTKDGSVLLSPSSVERVAQMLKNGDVDEALWFMAKSEMEARDREETHAKEMLQQTIQGQQQTAIMTEQEKLKSAMKLAEVEVKKYAAMANVDLQKEKELSSLKADQDYDIQLLKGEQVLEQINLEATLESQYGNEITGRV
jgi:hypothetical protein